MSYTVNLQSNVRTPYPRISFERAYGYLLKIRSKYPTRDTLAREELVQALDLSPTSGTTHTALGALSHYGFAYKTGVQKGLRYHLTELALALMKAEGSAAWAELALKAVMVPKTFEFLYSCAEHGELPNTIEMQLMGKFKEVDKTNVREIIRRYQDSIAFVNRDILVPETQEMKPLKQYELPLGNGVTVSVTEEVLIKALKHYLKDFDLNK